MPSASVTSLRVNPVPLLLAVTVTPGTAAFCASTIRPWMLPVVCCAAAGPATAMTAIASVATIICLMFSGLPCPRLWRSNCAVGSEQKQARNHHTGGELRVKRDENTFNYVDYRDRPQGAALRPIQAVEFNIRISVSSYQLSVATDSSPIL